MRRTLPYRRERNAKSNNRESAVPVCMQSGKNNEKHGAQDLRGKENKMRYETTAEEIKKRLPDYAEERLTRSKGKNQYNCPFCGSGTGSKGTGAFTVYPGDNRYKCFSCGASGDIFDLAARVEGTDSMGKTFRILSERYGMGTDRSVRTFRRPAAATDYTRLYERAHENIDKTDYHRGLSRETLDRFMVGFVPDWQPSGHPDAPKTPRLIIPRSPTSYLARDTRSDVPEYQKPYTKQSSPGKMSLFNLSALGQSEKPVYVVEGEIDAMSICDVGGEAVATCSTANVNAFVQAVRTLKEEKKPVPPLIIAFDDDDAGRNASQRLSEALRGEEVLYGVYIPHKGFKDANEALRGSRDDFRKRVLFGMEHIACLAGAQQQKKRNEYRQKNAVSSHLMDFLDGVKESVSTEAVTTGFPALDSALDGGLYEGLYCIGAVSSLGKTTFALQMADQIAESGHDALIFSLEMSRSELIAKSLSRRTAGLVLKNGGDMKNAKTARGIISGKRYSGYSAAEKQLINEAVREYSFIADKLFIVEAMGEVGTEEIRRQVEEHISCTGRKPVVIIDYLQILAPHNERSTDKQNTDHAVLQLKRLSRDFKLPVIAISSFNRENYVSRVSMQAFKESGAIEYSTDVLIGLQLKGAGEKGFDIDDAKSKNPREIEAVILKNRSGATGGKISFRYYTMFNFFQE